MIYTKLEQLVGKTPLFELQNLEKEYKAEARVLAKLEYLNPAGSVKDRAALSMLRAAEENGSLKD